MRLLSNTVEESAKLVSGDPTRRSPARAAASSKRGGSLVAGLAPDSTQEELPSADDTAAALSERTAPAVRPDYPSYDAPQFVEKEATFESRARLPRTPQQKNRELQPLAPASTRSERQRR